MGRWLHITQRINRCIDAVYFCSKRYTKLVLWLNYYVPNRQALVRGPSKAIARLLICQPVAGTKAILVVPRPPNRPVQIQHKVQPNVLNHVGHKVVFAFVVVVAAVVLTVVVDLVIIISS
jgi:hypothetical protein